MSEVEFNVPSGEPVRGVMREVLDAVGSARAVVFDVDGTLYAQGPVRRTMMLHLARAHIVRPRAGTRTLRTLAAYRRAQEALREAGFEGDVAAEQLHVAATRTGTRPEDVRALVERWMETAPLAAVAAHVRPGLVATLDELAARGLRLGVVSDYPAERKLEALGLAGRFDVIVTAQDPRVGAFKPNPKGILVALEELGVDARDALYVGDRPEVDAAAAAAAGVRCVLVGQKRRAPIGGAPGPAHRAPAGAREAT
jgi:putative hydrolase of the HAD superfamily